MDLQAIRDYVRVHMDIEADDLPDSVLDVFIREGSRKIESSEQRWPFYEGIFDVTVGPFGITSVSSVDASLRRISAIVTPTGNLLKWISREDAFTTWAPGTTADEPTHFSQHGDLIFLHPAPSADTTFQVFGYRKQNDWVADGSGGEPDMPVELHNTVALWALHRAYAQQEDLEQAAMYRQLFDAELNELGRRICEMPLERPLVMNSQPQRNPSQRYNFIW